LATHDVKSQATGQEAQAVNSKYFFKHKILDKKVILLFSSEKSFEVNLK